MLIPLATLVATPRAHNAADCGPAGNAQSGAHVMQPPTMEIAMRSKLAVLAAAALALAPLAVAAQGINVTKLQEADDDMKVLDRSVDDIEDMDLKAPDGDDIGEVEEVLLDAEGRPVAFAVEVGDREVVLGLDEVELKDDDLVTTVDKAAFEDLPVWDD
jgi:PRC-barrel domain